MESPLFIAVALGILLFGLVSRRAERSVITPPIFFVAFGLLVSEVLGVHLDIGEHALHTLAETTLILVLFTDASRVRLDLLRRSRQLPARLLLIGLPLTVGLGTLVAVGLFPALTLWEAALLAAVLAPTDAALGQAVVSSPLVPARIRQALNVESGLNDGIVLPVVLVFISACSSAIEGLGGAEYWLRFAVLQITLGPLMGWIVGYVGAKAIELTRSRGWMNHTFELLSSLGLALLAFAGAEVIGGNGFIAAFIAGLVLGNTASEELNDELHEFAEAEGQLLTLLVFMIFGASMVAGPAHAPGQVWLYGVLSLTVIRMVPVALSLIGSGLKAPTVLFLAWFGPRGIASILFGLLVTDASQLVHNEEVFQVVVATVLLSVVAHGMTSFPGTLWYAKAIASAGDSPEQNPVPEMRPRIRANRDD